MDRILFLCNQLSTSYSMQKIIAFYLFFLPLVLTAQQIKIAFGSCGHQDKPIAILKNIAQTKPDYFIYLGDNIYGDTRDMKVMQQKYDQLAANPNFKALKKKTKILATWDDHDYGENDAGKYYPKKEESKKLFLKFFDEPKKSDRWKHAGIYTSYMIEKKKVRVQIIMLDMRTFRDELTKFDPQTIQKDTIYHYDLDYSPTLSEDSTILGAAQWAWLKQEFMQEADVRIICSSTQFGPTFNGYEAWANFPYERQKMLELIQRTGANGVIFISGDVHYAELSKVMNKYTYPILDLTASGLTQEWKFATPNANRIAGPVMENHYGQLLIDVKKLTINMQIIDINKQVRIDYVVNWKDLKFK